LHVSLDFDALVGRWVEVFDLAEGDILAHCRADLHLHLGLQLGLETSAVDEEDNQVQSYEHAHKSEKLAVRKSTRRDLDALLNQELRAAFRHPVEVLANVFKNILRAHFSLELHSVDRESGVHMGSLLAPKERRGFEELVLVLGEGDFSVLIECALHALFDSLGVRVDSFEAKVTAFLCDVAVGAEILHGSDILEEILLCL